MTHPTPSMQKNSTSSFTTVARKVRQGDFICQRTIEGVEVTDRKTGAVRLAQAYKPEKYNIIMDCKLRYFKEQAIDIYIKRKQSEALPQHIRNRPACAEFCSAGRRNNVKASIFQLSDHPNNGKTRYRGLMPHQLCARCRSLSVNLVRIKDYLITPSMLPA